MSVDPALALAGKRTFKGACRTCGLPEVWHKLDRNGDFVLNAATRARVGNARPPVCWPREARIVDLAMPRVPFYRQAARVRRVA